MKSIAAVLTNTCKPLELIELEIPALKAGQALVEVKYSGVCHTQVSECRGHRGPDAYLPHCLGHEGSGIVAQVGEGVTKVKSGDRVVLSWMKGSGSDVPGTVYNSTFGKVNAGGITTFSNFAVLSENRLTLLPPEIPFREAALFGCAIPTGVGAVFNTAGARAGQSAVIFGVGGVGLSAVAGAALAECSPIVAVDLQESKLAAARFLGATHCIQAGTEQTLSELKAVSGNGFDIAVEATGRKEVMRDALESVRKQGGIAVILGNTRAGESLEIDPRQLNAGKQLRGSWGGDNDPDRDFPRYFDFLLSGQLSIEPLISEAYPLSRINEAIEDLEHGRVIRPLIEMAT